MVLNMKQKNKKLVNSFKYAIEGIATSFKEERNMKIHVLFMCLVIGMGFWLKISVLEWLICIILFSVVIAAELFNTAIETVVDMVMPEENQKAKIAKDVSAGAVLVLATGAAVIGIIIFLPKIMNVFGV